ncbi:hypothetical protein Fcan01_14088 [Folsomia candida]|uniref:Uncharacterized protein n=1 Tax=Folsomia candida TaxID=158441 RepID=A0A226E1C5_FOLCA|nr:hypothetical protein Fcan01_14088 [Folsomia candida]
MCLFLSLSVCSKLGGAEAESLPVFGGPAGRFGGQGEGWINLGGDFRECLSHFLPVSGLSDPVLGSRLILHVVESGGGGEGEKVGWLATFYTLLASEPGYVLGNSSPPISPPPPPRSAVSQSQVRWVDWTTDATGLDTPPKKARRRRRSYFLISQLNLRAHQHPSPQPHPPTSSTPHPPTNKL